MNDRRGLEGLALVFTELETLDFNLVVVMGGVRIAYTSQSPPAHSRSAALAAGSPLRRRWAMWLIVARIAGASHTADTSIHGRSRGRNRTRSRYRGCGARAMGPTAGGGPLAEDRWRRALDRWRICTWFFRLTTFA